jgi:glycosyltransferase involved in cell wall biosynthesis
MYKGKKVGVVVPCHNEEKLVGKVIETMPDFVDKIIVVDDCSTDKTEEVVRTYVDRQPDRVELISHEKNQGVGGAIVTGYKRAMDLEIDATAVMGGDAQMDPADLPELLDPVVEGKAEYSKGNRLFTGGAWKMIPHVRYLGNSGLSFMTKIASGYWHIADSQAGYTVISLDALKMIEVDKIYKRYGMPNDILVRLNVYDCRVHDVHVKPIYGVGEKSGIKLRKVLFTIPWLLLKLFLWRMKEKYVIRNFHPLLLFYAMGIPLFFGGIIFGLYLMCYRVSVGRVEPTSALFAMFMFITGMQSLFFAMWFDMEENRHLR